MADFSTQIQALVGSVTESEIDDWCTEGVKELINILPSELKMECATITSLTSSTPMDLDATGEVFHVTRENADNGYHIGCRRISPIYAGSADDSTSIHYVTATDPIYWIESDTGGDPKLFVKPTPTANQPARVHHVAFPTVDASAVSAIVNFPNEAEYLVVLYASVKVLQNKMNELSSNTDITTALTAVNTELDETQAICDLINGEVDKAFAEVALANAEADEMASQTDGSSSDLKTALDAMNTALDKFRADGDDPALFGDETQYTTGVGITRVENALNKAQALIDEASMEGDTEPQSVQYWLNDEDTEMVQATLATAQSEIQRAQVHIAEWNATVQTLSTEADGFAKEAQARGAFTGAKAQVVQSYISTANGYIQTASGYSTELQAKIGISNGYIAEANARMQRDNQTYQWYQGQQAKLEQDYDKGMQILISSNVPKQSQKLGDVAIPK